MNSKLDSLDIVKYRRVFFLASGTVLVLGLLFLALFGLELGVDFVSGTRLDVYTVSPQPVEEVLALVREEGLEPGQVQVAGNQGEILILRFDGFVDNQQVASLRAQLEETYGPEADLTQSSVEPEVARSTAVKAVLGILLASVGIVIYIILRFEYRFALSAIASLLHNALLMVIFFSLFRLEVDLTFIAAVLTVVGYSINDTIVIFDRIRENLKVMKVKYVEDLEELVNLSIRQTLARSVNTVLTVLFAAAALFLFAGEGIRNFSLALLVGLAVGAYSSICIASQLWVTWRGRSLPRRKEAA